MKTATQKSLLIIASLAIATFTGPLMAGHEDANTSQSSREERMNWEKKNRDGGTSNQIREGAFSGVDADQFGTGLGISMQERSNLFAFWDQQDIASRLNLTDEQRETLADSFTATTKKIDDAKNDAREAITSLRQELNKDEPSVSDVEGYSDQLADAMKAKQKAIFSHAALVKQTLNADQESVLVARNSGLPFPNKVNTGERTENTPRPETRPNVVGYTPSSSNMIKNGGGYEGYDPISQTYTSRYHNTNQK